MIPWMLLPAHVRRSRLRSLLTVGSVAIAIFLFCILRSVVTGIESTVSKSSSSRVITSSAVSLFVNLPVSMWDKIRSVEGVRSTTHWTWFAGVYQDPKNFFAQFATDPASFREVYGDRHPKQAIYVLSAAEWDAFEKERTACVVGSDLAEAYGFKVGDRIPLSGTIYPGDYEFTVRGIYTTSNNAFDKLTMFFHWNYLDEKQGNMSSVSTFTSDLASDDLAPEVATAVDAMFESSPHRCITLTEQAFQAQFVSMWGNYTLFLSFIGGAVLVSAFMVTLNTLLLNARERVTEVGVLKTLGFPDASVGLLNLAEGVVLCGLGGLVGVGVVLALEPALVDTLKYFVPTFEILPATAATALGIALGLGALSGTIPGLLAARMPVVRALRRVG
ncbi:MAG TPA: FtsX-like permease family protein [Planctomycetota bacterium]|nr:FtsX-like permease family protein [Planctomycetota bacterium]